MPTMITLVDGTIPVAADFNTNYTRLNQALGTSTSISAWAVGELPYASATDTLARLAPGTVGKVLTMGATVPGWEGGAWTTQAFSAGDFTAGGAQTWTVAAGDVTTNAYMVIGKTLYWSFDLVTTTVGGTPNAELRITLPGSKTAAKVMFALIRAVDNGVADVGMAIASTGLTYLSLRRSVAGTDNWSAATDATEIQGFVALETT